MVNLAIELKSYAKKNSLSYTEEEEIANRLKGAKLEEELGDRPEIGYAVFPKLNPEILKEALRQSFVDYYSRTPNIHAGINKETFDYSFSSSNKITVGAIEKDALNIEFLKWAYGDESNFPPNSVRIPGKDSEGKELKFYYITLTEDNLSKLYEYLEKSGDEKDKFKTEVTVQYILKQFQVGLTTHINHPDIIHPDITSNPEVDIIDKLEGDLEKVEEALEGVKERRFNQVKQRLGSGNSSIVKGDETLIDFEVIVSVDQDIPKDHNFASRNSKYEYDLSKLEKVSDIEIS